MAVSAAEQRALVNLARAANRRLERATEGQRAYLELYVSKYHARTRESGMTVFSQAKAKSSAEYAARMKELTRFMEAKSSTRKGWEAMKKAQVESAGSTLRGDGANITDEELALILEELGDAHGSADFYKALNNVEIAKSEQGAGWEPSAGAIRDAMEQRRSDQQRALNLINARNARKAEQKG